MLIILSVIDIFCWWIHSCFFFKFCRLQKYYLFSSYSITFGHIKIKLFYLKN